MVDKIAGQNVSVTSNLKVALSSAKPADTKGKDFYSVLTEVFERNVNNLQYDPQFGVFRPNNPDNLKPLI